jgi:hypothetical protein
MPSQTLVFIALPNGFAAPGRVGLSLYLTPRLDDGATLDKFPDLLNWTSLIKDKGLAFSLACGTKTTTVAVDGSHLNPQLWSAIFKPDTFVAPYEVSGVANRLIVSYPVRDCLSCLKYLYQAVGAGRSGVTGERGLEVLMRPFMFRSDGKSTLDDARAQMRVQMWREQHSDLTQVPREALLMAAPPDGVPAPMTVPANATDTATRFALFHHIPEAPHRPPLPSTPEDFKKTLDFHQALTALASYPALMRSLGLVFDLELPANFFPASPSGGAYLTVSVKALKPGFAWSLKPTISGPATAYVRDASTFASAPATDPAEAAGGSLLAGDVEDGFLALSPDDFQLVQVDLDGAMLKTLMLADNVALNPATAGGELNSLRSGGIGLVANGRGEQLLQSISDNLSFADSLAKGQDLPRALNARDVTRGFRLDVFSAHTKEWHSLHRRNGAYAFGAQQSITVQTQDEEGFLQPAAASAAADPTRKPDPVATGAGIPQPDTDLFLHERVARWDGWSLSAPRPGIMLNRDPDPAEATTPDPTIDDPITPFKLTTRFEAVPGSLPQLRFGQNYRIRARAVDLAGNSPSLKAETSALNVLPTGGAPFPYLRFEPVPPPQVVLQAPAGDGASLERLVIRSFNSDPSRDADPSGELDARHIAPPRAAARMVEQHGLFDDAYGRLRGDAALFQMMVARDAYEVPSKNGVQMVSGTSLPVLYLPDPLSRGAALRALPGAPVNTYGRIEGGHLGYAVLQDVQPNLDSVTFVDFGDQWPERKSFLLTLQEGAAAPGWDAANRVLSLGLEKAAVAVVDLSSYLPPGDLALMGVWAWIRELFDAFATGEMTQAGAGPTVAFASDVLALITRLALEGGHEMISPSRTLTAVHAVQQPLGLPTFIQLPVVHQPSDPIYASALRNDFTPITAWRSYDSHTAVLLGGLQINANSTSRIDLHAAWKDVTDDTSQPAPTSAVHADVVETIQLAEPDGPIYAPGSTSRMVAIYMPPVDSLWFAASFDHLDGVEAPSPPDVAAPVHKFNDTKHRWVTYTATATSRYQEYFPDGLDFTRTGPALVVDVPSSARPSAPEVVYVVPTFGWEQQETTNLKSSIRSGNSARVYLDRPWYSSGEDELLGVVLWPQALSAPDYATREKYKPYFTQWGGDPIWQTDAVSEVPGIFNFPVGTQTASGLVLAETPQTFDVAAFPVQYDEARRIWFCDIQFSGVAAYGVFVRMALARYQSHSIQGVELSKVVLADIVQLSSDRSAVVSIDPANPRQARVFIAGLAPSGPQAALLQVFVEQRTPKVPTDAGWQPAPSSVVTVSEDSPAPSVPGNLLWAGTVAFAADPKPGNYRIVVREYEQIPIYAGPDAPSTQLGQRLVYAAIIPYDVPATVPD